MTSWLPLPVMESLVKHIESFIPVSEQLNERLREIAQRQVLVKGTFLHQPGKICSHTYFIVKGLVRTYYQKDEKEITDNFAAEGEWITSVQSFMKNVPDYFYIQTLEDSELLSIQLQQLEQCFSDFPEMERFGRMLLSHYFMEQSERIIALQFQSSKERYSYFAKSAPHKLVRVPLGMLASYLGMTPETLSRVRAADRTF